MFIYHHKFTHVVPKAMRLRLKPGGNVQAEGIVRNIVRGEGMVSIHEVKVKGPNFCIGQCCCEAMGTLTQRFDAALFPMIRSKPLSPRFLSR